MLSKENFYKKVEKRYGKKHSIDFWFNMLFELYSKKKLTEKEIFKLLDEVNENQT